jgi:hypothetical protein
MPRSVLRKARRDLIWVGSRGLFIKWLSLGERIKCEMGNHRLMSIPYLRFTPCTLA